MWPRNSVNLDDFCENRRFPGFGSVDGSRLARHCMCARGFFSIIGRRADKDVTEIARHLEFVKNAMISRFRFDPVHLGAPITSDQDVDFW